MISELKVLIITLFLTISGCLVKSESEIKTEDKIINIDISSINLKYPIIVTLPEIVIEKLYPKPIYIPTLRSYEIDKTGEIWHAKNPSSYITPDNEWVQYYAKNDLSDGVIYRTDDDMYNYPVNNDMWQNADYTLYSGYGDCEDIAIVQVSIDIVKGKKAIVVGGYVTLDNGHRIRDFWEEVYSNGIKSIKFTNPVLYTQKELRLEPLFMFNDKISWRNYNENW